MEKIRWITAERIHDGMEWLQEGTFIAIDGKGCIQQIQTEVPDALVDYYEGWICPGFVNVHCHLELSHMKGAIPKHRGLIPFLQSVVQKRTAFSEDEKLQTITDTINSSRTKGIVAFGDICNTADTIPAKLESDIYFHSFIESMGKVPSKSTAAFDYAYQNYQIFKEKLSSQDHPQNYAQSLVPHAPYSVSDELFRLINTFDNSAIMSIHSQETKAEEVLFETGTGPMIGFYESMGIPLEYAAAKGINSLQWILQQTSDIHSLILVHNTFINKQDIKSVKQRAGSTYFCLCPNANLYIENTLPPIKLLQEEVVNICIGTDSLASNDQICVFAELQTIHTHFPTIGWEEMIRWATLSGAQALQIDDDYGRIVTGKKPGLVWINADKSAAQRID